VADTRRLPGLDLFRGLLLIGGPLVHSTFIAPPAVAHAVIEGSGLFRMAAFFAISGFLGGTTYRPGWLRLRLVQVGVPALFGILILNRYQAYVGGKLLVVEIYWFLLALLAYMPIGALIGRHCRALTSLPALILIAVGAHGLGDLLFGAGTYAAEAAADLPFYLFGWGVPTYDSAYVFDYLVHTRGKDGRGPTNATGYSNPDIDAKIVSLASESDKARRDATIKAIWQTVQQERFYIPIHDQVLTYASNPKLDIPVSPENTPYFKFVKVAKK